MGQFELRKCDEVAYFCSNFRFRNDLWDKIVFKQSVTLVFIKSPGTGAVINADIKTRSCAIIFGR